MGGQKHKPAADLEADLAETCRKESSVQEPPKSLHTPRQLRCGHESPVVVPQAFQSVADAQP